MANKIDLDGYVVERWKLDDKRLPLKADIVRTPPSADFIASMRNYMQLYPIMMCHNTVDGWFLAFGNKRLLALWTLQEENPEKFSHVLVRIAEGITKEEGHFISMIENAQRSDNAIHAYEAIRYILVSDKTSDFKSIAAKIQMPVTYVKSTAEKYGRIPDWALRAALDGKIAETTALAIGKFTKGVQVECKKELEVNGKLPLSVAKEKKRFIQKNIVATMAPAMGFVSPTGNRKAFYPVKVLDELKVLLDAGKYPQAKKKLEDLLK